MTLYALEGVHPSLPEPETCWIAPDANIIGNVTIARNASVWFGSTLRGDNEPIVIGEGSNVQDGCVIHTDPGFPFALGRNSTVGHRAMLHGCTIGDGCLIGMGATVLNGAVIGDNSVVGACALVTENRVFPEYSLLLGTPARITRILSEEELLDFRRAAAHYRRNISRYRHHLARLGNPAAGEADLSGDGTR